jgi:hypothetical protein
MTHDLAVKSYPPAPGSCRLVQELRCSCARFRRAYVVDTSAPALAAGQQQLSMLIAFLTHCRATSDLFCVSAAVIALTQAAQQAITLTAPQTHHNEESRNDV